MPNSISHLQLNTFHLNQPHKVIDFFQTQKIDIATLQEINVPIDNKEFFLNMCQQAGLHYAQSISWFDVDHNQAFGNGILSRHPIVDFNCTYYNGDNFNPKKIKNNDMIGPMLANDYKENITGSRGIKYSIISSSILQSIIKIDDKYLKVITTHYPVSDNCIEINSMYDLSQMIKSLVTYSGNLPIIFAGDLNIRAQSYSVRSLNEVLDCHTSQTTNTLSNKHPARTKDYPEGLAVDHIFSRGLKHQKTTTHQIDFSDHQALISNFTF